MEDNFELKAKRTLALVASELGGETQGKGLIFVQTKVGVDKLAGYFKRHGDGAAKQCAAFHGNKTQIERTALFG